MGNRIYGCDDCQLFCPWNKFAEPTAEGDFAPRHDTASTRTDRRVVRVDARCQWLGKTEGSAIRRIGYEQWLRNIAVALGNAQTTAEVVDALNKRRDCDSKLVAEHVAWALAQHVVAMGRQQEQRGQLLMFDAPESPYLVPFDGSFRG